MASRQQLLLQRLVLPLRCFLLGCLQVDLQLACGHDIDMRVKPCAASVPPVLTAVHRGHMAMLSTYGAACSQSAAHVRWSTLADRASDVLPAQLTSSSPAASAAATAAQPLWPASPAAVWRPADPLPWLTAQPARPCWLLQPAAACCQWGSRHLRASLPSTSSSVAAHKINAGGQLVAGTQPVCQASACTCFSWACAAASAAERSSSCCCSCGESAEPAEELASSCRRLSARASAASNSSNLHTLCCIYSLVS